MRTPDRLGFLSVVAFLAGCATSSLDLAPAAPNVPWTPATRSDGEIVAGAPESTSGPRDDSYVLPSNPRAAGEAPAPAGLDESHAYTLAELIDLAESYSPLTRVAWENARDAALATGIAKAAYLPSLTASVVGAYHTGNSKETVYGTQASGGASLRGSISAVSVQWLLFDFGERGAVVSAAEQGSVIANIGFTAAHQQLIYRVALAYYFHMAARARVATAQRALRNAKEVQAAAESRRAHGVGTIVEVAQARQGTAQAELAQVDAIGQAQDTRLALLAAMGISPLTPLKVAALGQHKLSPALAGPIGEIVREALARRPDVLSAYAAHEASLDSLRAAQAEFMPKVFLSATGSYVSNTADVTTLPGLGQAPPTLNIAGTHLGGTVVLGITVPIYDGGVRRALEGEARANEAKADATLQQVRDEATREVVGAANRVRTSLAALDAADALASAAEITFEAALDAFRKGVGSVTDATRAETALIEAQDAATDAYSAALSSAATLALAAGALGTAPQ